MHYVTLTDTDFNIKRIFTCADIKEAKLVRSRLLKYKSFIHIYLAQHSPMEYYKKKKKWKFIEHNKISHPQFYQPFEVKVIPSNPFMETAK